MRILITGGAGFIGTNLADHFAGAGNDVVLFDNLSRAGVEDNARWLLARRKNVRLIEGDVRRAESIAEAVRGADRIFHLAAQVAVTTSVRDPRSDFDINLLGTLNVLEAAREHAPEAPLFYTSTNKVYGGLEDVHVVCDGDRYSYEDLPNGVPETRTLDFHSPYGCSKGAADQYVRDYSRIYGMRTVVFRMSCIYGPHQCGNEDQGWVAHFAREGLAGHGLNIYGDGRQVRDILYVEDLVRAFSTAADQISVTSGEVFNIGGGPSNTVSLRELIAHLEQLCETDIPVTYEDWRPGDQRIYVTDIARAAAVFGWQPQISKTEGVRKLVDWFKQGGHAA
ncbi:MAG: NAD-dependent epimerase/dehydratase [Armatimonadetes bacterium]|jgi:CDP-paratose 2-epimerase|nr:NAD-dependent epimerase/dehydratase [Armatimonadota bacterium]